MAIELLPQRTAVHVMPDALNRRQQHLVLCGPSQHQVEHFVVVLTAIVDGNRPLLLLDNAAQVVDVRPCRHFCGKGSDVAFKQLTRLENFKRPNVTVQKTLFLVFMLFRNAHHVHARPLANIHRPLKLKHQQRLAHDSAADAIRLGDVALRRQTRSHGIMPLDNLRP